MIQHKRPAFLVRGFVDTRENHVTSGIGQVSRYRMSPVYNQERQNHIPTHTHYNVIENTVYEYQQNAIGNTFYEYQHSVIGNASVIKAVLCISVFQSQLTILILHYRRKGPFPDSQE